MGGPGGGGGFDAIWQFIKGLGGGGQPGAVQQPGGAGAAATALAPGAPGAFPPPGGGGPDQNAYLNQTPQPGTVQQPQGTSAAAPPGAGAGMPGMAGMPPMPQQTFLDNPALQGLLAGYLNFIRSPRREGFGAALGSGGIGALSQYQEARRNQYLPQMLAAQLGVQHSEITKNLAGAHLDQMKAGEPERNLTANSETATQLQAFASTLANKNEAAMLVTFANSIKNDPTKSWGYGEAIKTFNEQARGEQELAHGELFREQLPSGGLGKAEIGQKEAAAAASRAEAKVKLDKLPYEVRNLISDNTLKQADAIKTNLQGVESVAQRKKSAQEIKASLGDQFDKGYPPAAKMLPNYRAKRDAAINQGMAALNLTDDGNILDRNKEPTTANLSGGPNISAGDFDKKIADAQARDPKMFMRVKPDGSHVMVVNGKEEPL